MQEETGTSNYKFCGFIFDMGINGKQVIPINNQYIFNKLLQID